MMEKNRFKRVGEFINLPVFVGHMKVNKPHHASDIMMDTQHVLNMQHFGEDRFAYWHEVSLYINTLTSVQINAYGKVEIDGKTQIVNLYTSGSRNHNKLEENNYRSVVWDTFRLQNQSEEQLINMIQLHHGNVDLALKFLRQARIVYSKETSKMGIDDPVLVGHE